MDLDNYSQIRQFHSNLIPGILLDQLGEIEWQTCVDLGCGDGSLIKALELYNYFDNKRVIAMDISQNRLKVVDESTQHVEIILGDACRVAIKDSSIDLVITSQVIEHVGDDLEMANEIYRILKPGGTAYISTVYKKWFGWYFYRCNGKWRLDPTHVREYTKDVQLLSLLESTGFTVLGNYKTGDNRPVLDSILRRLGAKRNVYDNKLLRAFRKISIPIPGYYIWELVCHKT